jgi:hypothetical protein
VKRIVSVARKNERSEAGLTDIYSEFLLQFPDQGLLRALARLDLAARKLPQAGELLALRPLGDQDAAVGVDQGHGDDENGGQPVTHDR